MTEQAREAVRPAEHAEQGQNVKVQRVATPERNVLSPQAAGAYKGLAQMFGLDLRAAVLVILVDLMLVGIDVISFGAFIVMGLVVAGVLGYIVYKIQKQWFGDDHESALIKALIVGLLTAIPAPLTPLVAVPCGILGVVQMVRRR